MMKRLILILVVALLGTTSSQLLAGDIATITKDDLKSMLDSSDVVVIDVRAGRDWSSSEFKIKGAQRQDPGDVANWASGYTKDKTIVLYCA